MLQFLAHFPRFPLKSWRHHPPKVTCTVSHIIHPVLIGITSRNTVIAPWLHNSLILQWSLLLGELEWGGGEDGIRGVRHRVLHVLWGHQLPRPPQDCQWEKKDNFHIAIAMKARKADIAGWMAGIHRPEGSQKRQSEDGSCTHRPGCRPWLRMCEGYWVLN